MIDMWLNDQIKWQESVIYECHKTLEKSDTLDLDEWEKREIRGKLAFAKGKLDAFKDLYSYLQQHNYTVVPKEVVDKYYSYDV